jgi:hypothetical protein
VAAIEEANARVIKSVKRPKSVTAIFWFFMVYAALSVLMLLAVQFSRHIRADVKSSMIYFVVFSILYPFFIAFGLREGMNWVRILYLVITPINLVLAYFTQEFGHVQIVFGLALYLIFLIILTRPKVAAFFKQEDQVKVTSL